MDFFRQEARIPGRQGIYRQKPLLRQYLRNSTSVSVFDAASRGRHLSVYPLHQRYPHAGFNPSLAKATAGARAKRRGISKSKRIKSIRETGRKIIMLTYQLCRKKASPVP